jgi:erythromycin esterase-like protein
MIVAPAPRVKVVPVRPKRVKVVRAETPAAAIPPVLTTPSPEAPVAPTAPPAPVAPAPAVTVSPDLGQIETTIDAALAQSDVAREAFVTAHVQAAMAALQAHRGEISATERERVMADVRQTMVTWKSQHMAETMARVRREVHAALESAEARKVLASDEVRRALREAAKAADEAHAAQGETPPN